jgi:hypothetical protein
VREIRDAEYERLFGSKPAADKDPAAADWAISASRDAKSGHLYFRVRLQSSNADYFSVGLREDQCTIEEVRFIRDLAYYAKWGKPHPRFRFSVPVATLDAILEASDHLPTDKDLAVIWARKAWNRYQTGDFARTTRRPERAAKRRELTPELVAPAPKPILEASLPIEPADPPAEEPPCSVVEDAPAFEETTAREAEATLVPEEPPEESHRLGDLTLCQRGAAFLAPLLLPELGPIPFLYFKPEEGPPKRIDLALALVEAFVPNLSILKGALITRRNGDLNDVRFSNLLLEKDGVELKPGYALEPSYKRRFLKPGEDRKLPKPAHTRGKTSRSAPKVTKLRDGSRHAGIDHVESGYSVSVNGTKIFTGRHAVLGYRETLVLRDLLAAAKGAHVYEARTARSYCDLCSIRLPEELQDVRPVEDELLKLVVPILNAYLPLEQRIG